MGNICKPDHGELEEKVHAHANESAPAPVPATKTSNVKQEMQPIKTEDLEEKKKRRQPLRIWMII